MNSSSEMQGRGLTRKEAAALISAHSFPIAVRTLANLAVSGGGPRFRKVGTRTLYARADCDAWASSKLGPAVYSTTELQSRLGGTGPKRAHPIKSIDSS